MAKMTVRLTILILSAALPLIAQPQQESLGDVARQVRAQHDKDTKKAAKTYTNDNLPARPPEEAAAPPPAPGEHPATSDANAPKPATPAPSTQESSKPPESPQDKPGTREYWQGKFKAARQQLAKAKELQQVSEDELNLLQIQQAREMNSDLKADLTTKVQAKQSEVDANKAATEAAQKTLADLENAFKESGAPDDWSHTD